MRHWNIFLCILILKFEISQTFTREILMFEQKKVKFLFVAVSTLASLIINIPNVWAIRNPDDPLPVRPKVENQKRNTSSSTSVSSSYVAVPDQTKLITDQRLSQQTQQPLIRDLRDLFQLQTVLQGKPKTEEQISVAILNQLKNSTNWLGSVKVDELRLDYVRIVPSLDGKAQDAYVRFVQQYSGVDIENSYVLITVKILSNWTIISSAQAQLYPQLKLKSITTQNTSLPSSVKAIEQNSLKTLGLEGTEVNKIEENRRVRFIDGRWHRVREVKYKESDYKAIIDEDTHETWAEDTRVYGTIQGNVQGRGVEFNPQATGTNLKVLKLKDLKLSASSGAQIYTDKLGNFNFPSETLQTTVSRTPRPLGECFYLYRREFDF